MRLARVLLSLARVRRWSLQHLALHLQPFSPTQPASRSPRVSQDLLPVSPRGSQLHPLRTSSQPLPTRRAPVHWCSQQARPSPAPRTLRISSPLTQRQPTPLPPTSTFLARPVSLRSPASSKRRPASSQPLLPALTTKTPSRSPTHSSAPPTPSHSHLAPRPQTPGAHFSSSTPAPPPPSSPPRARRILRRQEGMLGLVPPAR